MNQITIDYEYYIPSGKIKKEIYTDSFDNKYYTWFKYNSIGQLDQVLTNTEDNEGNGIINERAKYKNGLHDKVVLGGDVQSIDFQYNSRNWLTKINNPLHMGNDLFAMELGYENLEGIKDYDIMKMSTSSEPIAQYSGSISWMKWKYYHNSNPLVGAIYRYDRANWLKKADLGFFDSNEGKWNFSQKAGDVENINYDNNNNIKSIKRYTYDNNPVCMDNLNYNYETGTNKLNYVDDNVPKNTLDYDMDTQYKDNYEYDDNGNMITDKSKDIAEIDYDYRSMATKMKLGKTINGYIDDNRVYESSSNIIAKNLTISSSADVTMRASGEIRLKPGFRAREGSKFTAEITPSNGEIITEVKYSYDDSGNRTKKEYGSNRTYYVNDAFGKPVAVYDKNLTLQHFNIYGNALIGRYSAVESKYYYYLKDHLGSIRVVVDGNTKMGKTKYDYYPFGMVMNRDALLGDENKAQEKFTGKELDNEGGVDNYYFGSRYYDPSIGTWLITDPANQFHSPYVYGAGNPVIGVDPNGEWYVKVINYLHTIVFEADKGEVVIVIGNGKESLTSKFFNSEDTPPAQRIQNLKTGGIIRDMAFIMGAGLAIESATAYIIPMIPTIIDNSIKIAIMYETYKEVLNKMGLKTIQQFDAWIHSYGEAYARKAINEAINQSKAAGQFTYPTYMKNKHYIDNFAIGFMDGIGASGLPADNNSTAWWAGYEVGREVNNILKY